MFFFIDNQIFQQGLLHEELALLFTFFRHLNGFSFNFIMCFNFIPDLGQFFVGKIYLLLRETVDYKLLYSVMLNGIIPDDLHNKAIHPY